MSPEIAIWLNRAGLVLDLSAFIFASPELFGERGLQIAEKALRWLLDVTSGLLNILAVFALSTLACTLMVVVPDIIRNGAAGLRDIASKWYVIVIPLAIGGVGMLIVTGLDKAIELMKDDAGVRRRALIIGAVLFALGNILQLLATF